MNAALLSLLLFSSSHLLHAQGTRQWTSAHVDEFERGTPHNVSLRNDGRLEAAPALSLLAGTEATYVWSLTVGPHNDIYAGTGNIAGGSQLLRISAGAAPAVLASFKEQNVQSLTSLPDGDLIAATSPDGKVYRVHPGGKSEVVFDPAQTAEKAKYLWSVALAPGGDLLVATGLPAAIYRVSLHKGAEKPKLFFHSGDQHIRCLAVAKDGTVYAGSDGAGLLYRISAAGKAFALYAAPRHEVTSIALGEIGDVYIAAVGEKRSANSTPPPPAIAAITTGTTASLTATPSSTPLQSAAAAPAIANPAAEGSSIYRISADGVPIQLLALRDEVAYAVAFRNRQLFVATGNRGRIYRLDPALPGSSTDVAHVDAREATTLLDTSDSLIVGTGSSGRVQRLADAQATDATFTSEVFDADVTARWGRAELIGSGTEGAQLFARSGNVENPRDGLGDLWSDWTAVAPGAAAMPVPNARYLQWRVALKPGTTLASVTINYLPRNLPPQVDDIVVQTGARLNTISPPPPNNSVAITFHASGAGALPGNSGEANSGGVLIAQRDRGSITARWLAHDPNGDDLMYALYFRDVQEKNWHLIKDKLSERAYSFDASLLPDGIYELRVVASDAPVHTDGDTLSAERISPPFTVDTTPPVPGAVTASLRNGELRAAVEAHDATSPIARAEFAVDAGPWQYLEPVGKLSDSLTEHYEVSVRVAGPGEHTVAFRFFDRFENSASVKAIVR